MRRNAFTLLEVLMVVLIAGITAAIVTVNLPGDGSLAARAREEAGRLVMTMEEMSDRAAMEGRLIGLKVTETGCRFLYLSPRGNKKTASRSIEQQMFETYWDKLSWIDYRPGDEDTATEFDEGITAELRVGGLRVETKDETLEAVDFDSRERDAVLREQPQVLFYPTGEATPFRLRLIPGKEDDKDDPIVIIGAETGRFRLFDPEKDKLR